MKKTIQGGYYIKARQIRDSFIAHAAPCVRETWDYLLREANYSDKKYAGFVVERGQLFRSYREIREGLAWYSGYRKEMYSGDAMKRAMKALMNAGMVTLSAAPRGMLITICNYDFYQNPENYGRTDDRTDGSTKGAPRAHRQRTPINKNVKNNKNLRSENRDNNLSSSDEPKLDLNRSVQEIFDYWKSTLDHPRARLGDDRKKKIKARLKEGYTPDDIKVAIDGCLASPYHQGENDRGTVFDDLELICRDSKRVDQFMKLAQEPDAKLLSAKGRQAKKNGQAWLEMRSNARKTA